MADQKCLELLKSEKYELLLSYCKEKLDFKPDSEEHVFYRGVALTGLKDYAKAENVFTYLFTRTTKYFYLICRGLVRFLAKNQKGGKADLEQAIEEDESYANMFFVFRIASTYYDMDDAREALEKAMKLNKKWAMEELEKIFENLSESASAGDRSLFVRVMELLSAIG